MLQTVVIEHGESFWPRWLSRSAVEISGFFASADVGAAAQINLPSKRGELYATVTWLHLAGNGPVQGRGGAPNADPVCHRQGAAVDARASWPIVPARSAG